LKKEDDMQASLDAAEASVRVASQDGKYIAEFLKQPANWMTGTIVGKQFANDEERREYVTHVLETIQEVAEHEKGLSTWTDGRKRLKL
jgi:hypothetical protein